MKSAVPLALIALAAAASPAGEGARFAVEKDQVLLTYQAALGASQLSGVSRALVGSIAEVPGVGLRVSARAPIDSFESGSPGVDALFRRAVDADRFPSVEFEGQAVLGKRSGQFTVQLQGTLSLHGVSQRITVPVKVLRDGKTLFVKTAFPVDLASFGLLPTAIAGLKVSPRVQIELHALLRPESAAAFAGGAIPRG
jgi:polyisoprenoid-binding protein YceI